jgi:glycosyltransferase involved in cell wall biosynthesis
MGETTTSSPPEAPGQGSPAKPRVLFIQPFAGKGGSENVLLRILGSMDDRFDTSVLLLQRGELADQIEARGVHAEIFPLPGKRSVPAFPIAARNLAARLGDRGISVIHANGTKAALFGAFLAPHLDVPLLWMKHGHDFDWWAPRVIGPRCDRIVCVSKAVAAHFPADLQDRVSVIYPGVSLLPADEGATQTPPRVVCVGRLDPKKGIATLIQAMDVLRRRGTHAELDVVGPPNPKSPRYERRLRRLIEKLSLGDRVRMRGWVDDLDAAYRESRVVALASRSLVPGRAAEGTPLTLLEGMNHSRPVVAPQEDGIQEIVGDGGTLVSDGDPTGYADALAPYLIDASLAERVGQAAHRRVEESFTVDQLASKLEELYAELATEGGAHHVFRFKDSVAARNGDRGAPRIAVVIPCFNDGEFVRQAVESVEEGEPIELVVVDDASTDPGTRAEIDALEAEGVRVLRHEKNRGLSGARMTGVKATTAPYVFPLDSDDMSIPGALGAMADKLDSTPGAALAFGDYLEFGGKELIRAVPDHLDPYRLAYTNEYPGLSMLRRETLEQVGGWTAERMYEDWDLWMTLAEGGYDGVHMGPRVLTFKRRVHGGRLGGQLRSGHPKVYKALRGRHPKLFGNIGSARRRSDMGFTRKALYPVVYGGRPRFPGESAIKDFLDRTGLWTLKR